MPFDEPALVVQNTVDGRDPSRTYRFTSKIRVTPGGFAVPRLVLACEPVQQRHTKVIVASKRYLRTKTFLEQQSFEKDMLCIRRLVPDTYLLVLGAKPRLNEIHRP